MPAAFLPLCFGVRGAAPPWAQGCQDRAQPGNCPKKAEFWYIRGVVTPGMLRGWGALGGWWHFGGSGGMLGHPPFAGRSPGRGSPPFQDHPEHPSGLAGPPTQPRGAAVPQVGVVGHLGGGGLFPPPQSAVSRGGVQVGLRFWWIPEPPKPGWGCCRWP